MKSIQTTVLAVILIVIVVVHGGGYLPAQSSPSWSQLMFIEYVDQLTGSGVGLEIYNPSGDTVDLGSDNISIRFFNHTMTCTTSCPPPNDNPLVGQIPPGGSFVVGNSAYCDSCANSCDFVFSYGGLNGNDAVLLTRADTAIDMIGIPCFCIGPNYTSYTVGGVAHALYHHNIARCIGNTTYYSDSNGVYVSGNATTSWPNNQATNVEGWVVSTNQCIAKGHTENGCVLPISSLNVTSRIENCSSLISWNAEKADSFHVMKLGRNGVEMTRIGMVDPLPEHSEYKFEIHPSGEENSYFQIISWLGGERVIESELIEAKHPDGTCLPEAAILFPVPASEDLFVHLPADGSLKIEVYDLQGQLVISHGSSTFQREHFLSVKQLFEGVYFYRIDQGNGQIQTGKLLIHRE